MTNYKWGPVAERQTPRRRCERLRGTKSRPEEDVHFAEIRESPRGGRIDPNIGTADR
ncbi:hypothetical protein T03_7597 [Trichinella britovi]|uniref:Uncharacterized protein n=1 Tax=Trichinella britovi TaxID=45882 RepID=A0A0V1AQ43_TRIBR|nr:hypothetical protein T03_7597 [Trichinella britovi]